jgi:proteasome accessory factor C
MLSDLNTLWMCGESRFDLVDLDFDSGFVTIRNAETLNLVRSLSTQEIMTILFGLDMLKEDLDSARPDLAKEIDVVKSLLSKEAALGISATPAYDAKIRRVIDMAIQQRNAISLVYRSTSSDEISERTVDPLEVFYRENKLFLLAFCHNSEARRTFRMDHIERVDISATEFAAASTGRNVDEKFSVRIRVHSNLRRAHETFGELIENSDGSFDISIFSKQWFFRQVMASSGDVEILEPRLWRTEICGAAGHLESAYR